MEHRRIGSSGLEVSALTLGCMSFGEPGRGNHPWSLPEDESRAILRRALEAGITTFDTADVYSLGSSEEIVGRALRDFARREEVVIATKVFMPMREGPHGRGLSRAHIREAIDASLARLGTDHVDLYQIHRWDPSVPIEETMSALHDVVTAGKARYLGASSMWAWQFQKAQNVAERHGWTRFVSMQDHYNLLNREEEREMHPYCLDAGVGVLPWSPLARGRLARPWGGGTARSAADGFGESLYGADSDREVVEAVGRIAERRGVPRAEVALAWLRTRDAVTSPIVGTTRPGHLEDALASLELTLEPEELAELEAPYTPHAVAGF